MTRISVYILIAHVLVSCAVTRRNGLESLGSANFSFNVIGSYDSDDYEVKTVKSKIDFENDLKFKNCSKENSEVCDFMNDAEVFLISLSTFQSLSLTYPEGDVNIIQLCDSLKGVDLSKFDCQSYIFADHAESVVKSLKNAKTILIKVDCNLAEKELSISPGPKSTKKGYLYLALAYC
jgi:hypothetical protein